MRARKQSSGAGAAPKKATLLDSLLEIEGDEFIHDAAVQYITSDAMSAKLAAALCKGFEPSKVRAKPEIAIMGDDGKRPAAFADAAIAWNCCGESFCEDHPGAAIIEVKTGRLRIGAALRQIAAMRCLDKLSDALRV